MKLASKKIVETVAAILNRHVQQKTSVGTLLAELPTSRALVNDLLKELAEGGELVSAVEDSGLLLGFVPRYQVVIPTLSNEDLPTPADPPPGPDNP